MAIDARVRGPGGDFAWPAALWAGAALGLGALPVPLAMALSPSGSLGVASPRVPLPWWAFVAAWTFIYPALGVATLHVWRRRAEPPAVAALSTAAMCFVTLLVFLPVTAAAHDQRVTAMLDLVGLAFAYFTAWHYGRVDRRALRWLAPLLAWMPLTTVLKLAT